MKKSLLCLFILISCKWFALADEPRFEGQVLFITPKDPNGAYQLNEKSQFDLKKIKRKGWLIEANKHITFNIFIKFEMTKPSLKTASKLPFFFEDIFYLYFTTNTSNCSDFRSAIHFPILVQQNITNSKSFLYRGEIELSLPVTRKDAYSICFQNFNESIDAEFVPQQTSYYLKIATYENAIPFWLQIVIYIALVLSAAMFNGLNIGLISLSVDEYGKVDCGAEVAAI